MLVLKELKAKDSALFYKYNDLIKMRVPIGKEDTHLNSLMPYLVELQLEIDIRY
jgi:hypothetical protein